MNIFQFTELIVCLALLPIFLAPFAPILSAMLDSWYERRCRAQAKADRVEWYRKFNEGKPKEHWAYPPED